MPKIEANGIGIYYELHGPEGAEVLVLSNGILMGTASWGYQTKVLAQHYRVLLYDCRGMWQSDHPAGPYSMELHADDLAALLDALGIDRAHVAGISYGGELSLAFALKYPARARSLIVSSSVSQVDPLLQGLIGSWIAAARARDPEMLFQVTYPLNPEAWIAANQPASTWHGAVQDARHGPSSSCCWPFSGWTDRRPARHRCASPGDGRRG